jgi:type I restriction enzyme S subunit
MSWKQAKLGEICDFQGGSQPPKSNFVYEKKKNYVRFIQIRDFKSNKNLTYIPLSNKNKYCTQDDILIGRYGASVGKILTGLSGAYNVALMKTIPKQNIIDKKYLYLYLLSELFQKPLSEVSERSAQNGFSKDDIFDFEVPLPSLKEQQQIVTRLDVRFTEIDKVISITNKKIKNTNTFFENYLVKYFSNKNYKQIKLEDVCTATQGVQIFKSNQIKSPKKGYLRYLYISDFSNDKNVKYVENKYPKKIVKSSDIIVANTGASAGSIFRGIEGILSNNLFKVTSNKNLIDSDFLYYFVISNLFKNFQKKIMRGTANPHMGHENFLNTPLNLPNLGEQKKIISKIFELKKNVKNLNQNYSNKINSLNQLKLKFLSFNLNNSKAA